MPVQFCATVTKDLGRSRTRQSAAERDRVIKEDEADTGAMQTRSGSPEHLAKMLLEPARLPRRYPQNERKEKPCP